MTKEEQGKDQGWSPAGRRKLPEFAELISQERFGEAGIPLQFSFSEMEEIGHQVGQLAAGAVDQKSLFEQPHLEDVKHSINQAVGRFALCSGATLPLVDVYGDAANNYDICDIYGKSCF